VLQASSDVGQLSDAELAAVEEGVQGRAARSLSLRLHTSVWELHWGPGASLSCSVHVL